MASGDQSRRSRKKAGSVEAFPGYRLLERGVGEVGGVDREQARSYLFSEMRRGGGDR